MSYSLRCQESVSKRATSTMQNPSSTPPVQPGLMVEELITELSSPIPMWMMGSLKKQKPVMELNHQKQGGGGGQCLNYYNNAEA